MSAYDMQVSDDVYGKAGRYVSKERVEQMLSHEYDLLLRRLEGHRPDDTRYFVYAATVTARSYSQKNECHGWIGVRAQLEADETPSVIVLHVRMLDETNQAQSEALGVLGVNLVHGFYHKQDNPKQLIESLLDSLKEERRMEIDMIEFSGPRFEKVENRLMNLHLIHSWCCRAVMFDATGSSVVPASALRKKDTVVIRGSFKPPTKVHIDMKDAAVKQFLEEEGVEPDKLLVLAEITMNELTTKGEEADADFLSRVDLLNQLGFSVLISDYLRFFRLRSWIRRYTQNRIGIMLSVLDFDYLFDEEYYEGLEGGILEAFGKLFSDNTNVYVYPTIRDGQLTSLDNIQVPEGLDYLKRYLIENNKMVGANIENVANLEISAREIIKQIPTGDESWMTKLPQETVDAIVDRKLFNYKAKRSKSA